MRVLCIALCALTLSSNSWALKPLTTKAQQDELASINSMIAKDYRKLSNDKQTAWEEWHSTPHSGDIDSDMATREQNREKYYELSRKLRVLSDQIIDRTVKLYDIYPSTIGKKIVVGPFKDKTPTWHPVSADPVPSKKIGNIPLTAPSADYAAITWASGDVEVSPECFDFGAGYLGDILYHESIHFQQMTTLGEGDVLTPARSEMAAHSQSSSEKTVRIFQLTTIEEKRIKASFMNQLNASRNADTPGMTSVQFISDANNQPDLEKATRDAATSARNARAEQKKKSDEDRDEYLAWSLGIIARRACGQPDQLTDNDFKSLPEPSNHAFANHPPSFPLNECETKVYNHLRESAAWGYELSARDCLLIVSPPQPTAAPQLSATPSAAPTGPSLDELRRQLTARLQRSMNTMRGIVQHACSDQSAFITADDMGRFDAAYEILQENKIPQDGRLTLPGYEPSSALEGTDGCAYSLLHDMIYASSLTVDTANAHRAERYDESHPKPPPYQYDDRRRGGDGGDPCREHHNKRCPN